MTGVWNRTFLVGVALVLSVFAPVLLSAQGDRIDPIAPNAIELPQLGRMTGTIRRALVAQTGERFGRKISSVGDVNSDGIADWVVARVRSDTVLRHNPYEILLFRGLRGALPQASAGIRIGPTEIGASTHLITSGDFDADGHRDLVIAIHEYEDTADGNRTHYWVRRLVVMWGNPSGEFSIADTTQLRCEANTWISVFGGAAADLNGDGMDDLLIGNGGGFSNGHVQKQPQLRIFKGVRGARWGRDERTPRTAQWTMWTPPPYNKGDISNEFRLSVLDQDCDGVNDIVFHYNNNATPSTVAVLYGRGGGQWPDTLEIDSVNVTAVANGRPTLFRDVTGDGSPELLLNCGLDATVRVYAGRPGQRLRQQFGSGNDLPITGQGWWRRPWSEVWLPGRLHDGWYSEGNYEFLPFGDMNLDGRSEIWVMSFPFLLGYQSGADSDSLADAWVRIPGSEVSEVVHLGDIDGSGRQATAIGYDIYPKNVSDPFPGGILFVYATPEMPQGYGARRMKVPHIAGESCADIASAIDDDHASETIPTVAVAATYHRSRRVVDARWSKISEPALLTLTSSLGVVIATASIPPGSESISLNIGDLAYAPYFCTVQSSAVVVSTRVILSD